MKPIKDALIIIALILLCLIGWQTWQVLVQVETTIGIAQNRLNELGPIINGERNSLKTIIENANATAVQLGLASDQWMQASAEQRIALKVTTKLTNERLAQIGEIAARFDKRINDELLPTVTAQVRANGEASAALLNETTFNLRKVQEDVHVAVEQLNATALSTQSAIDQANKLMSDPSIPSTLAHIDKTTANVEKATGHVEKALRPARIWIGALQWGWKKVVEFFQVKAGT